jgi:hypothetical protein
MVSHETTTAPADGPSRGNGRQPAGWVDQVARRRQFEAGRPAIRIQPHILGEPWTALVPMNDGTDATIRDWELRGLLDRLEVVCADRPPETA